MAELTGRNKCSGWCSSGADCRKGCSCNPMGYTGRGMCQKVSNSRGINSRSYRSFDGNNDELWLNKCGTICQEKALKAAGLIENDMKPPTKSQRPTQNSLLSWECSSCDGLDVECQLVCKGQKLLFWGVIAYVGYSLIKLK